MTFVMIALAATTCLLPSVAAASDTESPAEALRDALDAEDADAALTALAHSPGDPNGLACVEALLREHGLAELWRPPPPTPEGTAEVAAEESARREAGITDLRAEVKELSAAYARCDRTRGPRPNAAERQAFVARREMLSQFLALPNIDEAALDALDAPETLDTSFDTARASFDTVDEVPPPPPEREPLPSWRATPVITSGLLTISPLMVTLIMARTQHGIGGRVGFASLGVGISSLVGLTVGRTWLRGGSTLVLVSGLLTAGVLGTGAITLAIEGPRRRRAFGASMLAGGAVDLAWWIGGVLLNRQDQALHREWLHQLRPSVDVGATPPSGSRGASDAHVAGLRSVAPARAHGAAHLRACAG